SNPSTISAPACCLASTSIARSNPLDERSASMTSRGWVSVSRRRCTGARTCEPGAVVSSTASVPVVPEHAHSARAASALARRARVIARAAMLLAAAAELAGALGGGLHRVDQRGSQAALLEGVQACDGRAARRGHHVLQAADVLVGLEQHLGRAHHGL